jgi:2-keto-4-pentenoate hydratase/2-oxohepta-3-ene-1,7-dioic acid hydratase in catechol pathway
MRLARFEKDSGLEWGAVTDGGIVDLSDLVPPGWGSVHELLGADGRARLADCAARRAPGPSLQEARLAPFLPDPRRILCVGVNYPDRNAEYRDSSEAPSNPSLFIRFASSFVAHGAAMVRPRESRQLDYEGELAIVIGKPGRRIRREEALGHVAGVTIVNDGTVRDWTRHAKFNVTQGKNFDASGAIGPWMVTIDEVPSLGELRVQTKVNGELRQDD